MSAVAETVAVPRARSGAWTFVRRHVLTAYAVLAFYRAAQNLGDAAPGEDEKINPYAISLDPERWEADGLFIGQGLTVTEARESPAGGMENLLMEAIAQPA